MTDLSGWSPWPTYCSLTLVVLSENEKCQTCFTVWIFCLEVLQGVCSHDVSERCKTFFLRRIHTVLLCAGLPSSHRRLTTPGRSTPSSIHQLTKFDTCKRQESSLGNSTQNSSLGNSTQNSSLGISTLSLKKREMLTNNTVFYVRKTFCAAT